MCIYGWSEFGFEECPHEFERCLHRYACTTVCVISFYPSRQMRVRILVSGCFAGDLERASALHFGLSEEYVSQFILAERLNRRRRL